MICAIFVGGWCGGFGWFLWTASKDVLPPGQAGAAVVLTGGPDRVEVALRLLTDGTADRLLVSGAGDRTDAAVLAHLAGIDPARLEGKIEVRHAAHSTRGNALETASWVQSEGVESLLLVTAWFHMPRALIEFRRAMPGVSAHPYPVGHFDPAALTHAGTARRVIEEYIKYLAAVAGLTASPYAIARWGAEPDG